MIEHDPKLETFYMSGSEDKARLSVIIKQMVADLSDEYMYKNKGMMPSRNTQRNWLMRLKRSYYKKEVIEYETY